MDLRIVDGEADLWKALIVRGIVFVEEQRVPYDGEVDAHEATAIHVLGEEAGEPVAVGRLRRTDDGWGKLERIAVRPAWRGRGFGREVVRFLLDEAEKRGWRRLMMHAQVHLEDFYREFGFEPRGEIFVECGIDHLLMVREG